MHLYMFHIDLHTVELLRSVDIKTKTDESRKEKEVRRETY
jgi:hypothetical protein